MNSQSTAGFDDFVAGLPDFDFFAAPFFAAFFIARCTASPTPRSVAPLRKAFLTSFSIALRAFSVFFFAIAGFLIRCNVTVIQYDPCAARILLTSVVVRVAHIDEI
jgi:hypothetical protein